MVDLLISQTSFHQRSTMADNEASGSGSGSSSGQNLWSRLTSSRARRGPDEEEDDDEDTEPLLPSRSRTGRVGKRLWPGWEQVIAYLIVLVLCFGAGWYTSKAFTRRGSDKKGDGPMVPPVWTLPPVSHYSHNGSVWLVNASLLITYIAKWTT